MAQAQCSCGSLVVTLPGPAALVVACHCVACQRRTGSPFGVGAFYPLDSVAIAGPRTEYSRAGTSGGNVRTYFCPTCGSSVYWTADKVPNLVGVAVGALADPSLPGPLRSIYEESMHDWVRIDCAVDRFPQGTGPRPAG